MHTKPAREGGHQHQAVMKRYHPQQEEAMLIIWESLRIPLNNMSLLAGEAIVISSFESLEESMQSGLECLDLLQLVQL